MKYERILGIALLLLGLGIIAYALFASYGIFVEGKEAPQIFQVQERQQITLPSEQEQFSALVEEQLSQLVPAESIPQVMNLLAWSVFAGILLFGGGQVAGLGLRALKA